MEGSDLKLAESGRKSSDSQTIHDEIKIYGFPKNYGLTRYRSIDMTEIDLPESDFISAFSSIVGFLISTA
jgi:hypothetical protein